MRMVGPAADRRVPRLHTRVVTKTPRSGNVVEATGAGEAGSARGAGGAGAPARTVGQAFERVLRWVDDRILAGELAVGDHPPPSASSRRRRRGGTSSTAARRPRGDPRGHHRGAGRRRGASRRATHPPGLADHHSLLNRTRQAPQRAWRLSRPLRQRCTSPEPRARCTSPKPRARTSHFGFLRPPHRWHGDRTERSNTRAGSV